MEETIERRCGWCQLPMGAGSAHLSKDVCIKSLQQEYAALVGAAATLDAANQSLKMTARIAWILINRTEGKKVVVKESELKDMPAGARAKATPNDDRTITVEAVVRQQEGSA